jgi:hypothetical protein
MGVSFRSPHRYASIYRTARLELAETASLTLNFSKAKPHKAEVAEKVDLPACPDIAKRPRRR